MHTSEKRNPVPAVREQTKGDGMRPPESEPKEVDMAAIEAKVAERIAPMSDDVPKAAEPSPTRKLTMPGKDPDPTPEPGSVDPDPLVPASEADEKKTDDGPPAIPENYIKAAKHLGVTEEEVAEMYEDNPERAIRILKGYHETVNKTSQSFATLGRKQQQLNAQATQKAAAPAVPATPVVDYAKLEEEYGKDSPLIAHMKRQDEQLATFTAAKAAEPAPQQNVDAATMSVLDSFFGSDGMKPFQNFYGMVEGGNWSALNAGEFAQREAVIDYAEAYIMGKEVQGEIVPLDQALGLAHLSVSGGMREQAVRAEIKAQIKTKAKGVTLAPSSSKATGTPGRNADGTKTKTQLEADTAQRLQNLRAGKPLS